MPPVTVAVVGAGIAGLTVALRLLERGYDVTVHDRKAYLGGKLGAHTHPQSDFEGPEKKPYIGGHGYRPGTYHEHCYHMFLSWYHNFWALAEDIGLRRGEHFEARHSVKYLRRGEFPRMITITDSGSPGMNQWDNVTSGLRSIPDMILSHYSVFDTLAQRFDEGLLSNYTVNGFVQSRPYATEGMASLYQEGFAKAFACPSYLTSARSYQAFMKYSLRQPSPMMWLLKNDVHHGFMEPLRAKLDGLGCRWKLGHHVTKLQSYYTAATDKDVNPPLQRGAEISSIPSLNPAWPHPPRTPGELAHIGAHDGALKSLGEEGESAVRAAVGGPPEQKDEYDYVVLCVPPNNLRAFFADSEFAEYFVTEKNQAVQKLHFEPMASIDVYFKRKLFDGKFPREHIGLLDSTYGLTMIDNSQLWPGIEGTALNIVSTDFRGLVDLPEEAALRHIVSDLQDYLPPISEDDLLFWHIEANAGDKLFVNEIGSERWRPGPKTRLSNVFLAGDYCRTFIDVVTVEGAVVSALQAVQALQEQVAVERHTADTKLLDPVTIIEPDAYPRWMMLAGALTFAPYAAAAKVWSWVDENLVRPQTNEGQSALDAPGLVQTAINLAWMPWQIGAGLVNVAWSTYADFWRGGSSPPPKQP
jgi:flavin-dependent amine oxidoreductase/FAD dependent oxidoreductase